MKRHEKNYRFVFDTNLCIGCHACVAACDIENGNIGKKSWRSLYHYNPVNFAQLPLFHYSIACNHCLDAPCITNCPARALYRDDKTGLVLVNENRCMGCQYCIWTCPYDAPAYDPAKAIIQKCNFCLERLENGEDTACVDGCVTGALKSEKIEAYEQPEAKAFEHHHLRPSIRIKPKRKQNTHIPNPQTAGPTYDELKKLSGRDSGKITPRKEWSLVSFSLLASVLAGYAMGTSLASGFSLEVFLPAGMSAGLLSIFHLGKKFRALNALRNWKSSWLSREIISFGLFMVSGIIFGLTYNYLAAGIMVAFSLGLLISIDRVYAVTKNYNAFHSASVVGTGLTAGLFFYGWIDGLVILLAIRMYLYLYRNIFYKQENSVFTYMRIFIRVAAGIILPMILIHGVVSVNIHAALILIIAGDIIDRVEFFKEIDSETPQNTMNIHLRKGV